MCMDKYAVKKLGSLIGKLEDVDTDEAGECVGPIVRTRISVDVTRPLQKILFLQQEDGVKTPIGIQYERLPKFCFCCGLVGHQYRECLKYKGQPKEKLAYGSWLKALPVTEWNRKNRGRGNWNKEHHQQNLGMVNTVSQNQNQTRQTQSNPEKENGSGQSESGQPITPMEMGKVKEVAEEHLMQAAVNGTNIRDNRLHDIGEAKLSNAAGKCSPRKLECRAGTSGRRECESRHYIDAKVQSGCGKKWRCTGVYGHPEAHKKQHTWTLLRRLSGLSSKPWLCFGDFNEILRLDEKSEGNDKSFRRVSEFREAVQDSNLADLGYKGYQFTWCNGRDGHHFVEERLDRFLCNEEWRNHFQEQPCQNLVSVGSDHYPIMMEIKEKGLGLHEEEFGGRERKLKTLMKELQKAKQSKMQYEDTNGIKQIEKQIHNILLEEEIYWRHRARADWLQAGDKNTKFFHSKATTRKRKNRIWGVENKECSWTEDGEAVEREFCDYFQQHFTSSKPSQDQMNAALEGLTPKVTATMNDQLNAPFTSEEISEALFQMCPTKAPGPDGLHAVFFQKHWQYVGKGVTQTCLHILNDQGNLSPLNHTFIALILKVAKPRKVTEYRLISLCNAVYRIVAKVIANSLVFTKASIEDCRNLKAIFDCYAAASGQIFNYEKSSMFCSGKLPAEQITAIKNIFQLKMVSKYEKYLGLPSMIGREKMSFFNEVKLNVLSKISNWQNKFFSNGGKEVLIKAVAQAVPAYAMSVFKLPLTLCEGIQKAIAKFWWGTNKETHNIHWARWERMSHAKLRGGLGFRDISCFNQALVAKQSWRIIQDPESLMARVLKARYFKNDDFLEAKIGSNPSFIWRSILWGRQIILKGSRWRIGSGENIQVYRSNWLPRPTTFRPISPRTLAVDTKVAELISPEGEWKRDWIQQHFFKEDAEIISRIPLPRHTALDELCWHYDKLGKYSVKSGYQLALKEKFLSAASSSNPDPRQWNAIWKLDLPEKIKIFMWRAVKNLLPTAENLWKRKEVPDPICQRCKRGVETSVHAMVECKAARKIGQLSHHAAEEITASHGRNMFDIFLDTTRLLNKKETELQVAYWWATWNARNHFLFKKEKLDALISVAKAEGVVDAYRKFKRPEQQQLDTSTMEKPKQWKPPPENWCKVNVDAATDHQSQRAGLGVVIRNDKGDVVAAAIKPSSFNGDVPFAEAEAIKWGMQVAKRAGINAVILESDCQVAIDLANNRKGSKAEIF
ncbi:putative reverse transcriptase/RNA-dependent DNA polymerase [Citrus sinensis]|nr:putative reverse transcriptase/RNA-dependent DNA polymerase [Citrus sinensis]